MLRRPSWLCRRGLETAATTASTPSSSSTASHILILSGLPRTATRGDLDRLGERRKTGRDGPEPRQVVALRDAFLSFTGSTMLRFSSPQEASLYRSIAIKDRVATTTADAYLHARFPATTKESQDMLQKRNEPIRTSEDDSDRSVVLHGFPSGYTPHLLEVLLTRPPFSGKAEPDTTAAADDSSRGPVPPTPMLYTSFRASLRNGSHGPRIVSIPHPPTARRQTTSFFVRLSSEIEARRLVREFDQKYFSAAAHHARYPISATVYW